MPNNNDIKRHLHIEYNNGLRRDVRTATLIGNYKNMKTFVKAALVDKILDVLKNSEIVATTSETIDRLEKIKAEEKL